MGLFFCAVAGRQLEAQDLLAKGLVAGEQAAIDRSRFDLAWLLTFAPQPPWGRMAAARLDETQQFAVLAEPAWTTTAVQYTKDVAGLMEARRKVTGKGKGKGKDKDSEEK